VQNLSISRSVASILVLFVGLTCLTGCEEKGPAAKAGAAIDRDVQKAKDTISPPGPTEKAGRAVDNAIKN
jgi:predicted small lipoprotein YifL